MGSEAGKQGRRRRQPKFRRLWVLLITGAGLFWWFSFPSPLFHAPYATVLTDRRGELLEGRIASDGQWRFPAGEAVPERFRQAILAFEDRWFYHHPGINPVSLFRAWMQNLREGRIVRGGSTLSMQVVRLALGNPPRTYPEKIREILMALRLECSHTKEEILALYAAHAPFGGNVVGLEAASWRYFGVKPDLLSTAQAATLAVLPNAPALIFPGRNSASLKAKRDRLLQTLFGEGVIDSITLSLSLEEPLPELPHPLPHEAPHLLDRAIGEGEKGKRISATIDAGLQRQTREILVRHADYFRANELYNAAALVVEVRGGQALAYVGNLPEDGSHARGHSIDLINARRSTGSLLKPLLYAAMLDAGMLSPLTLIPDIPTRMGGFMPENFNRTYDGAVEARQALVRSLNIPFVRMLQQYGVARFYRVLKSAGMVSLDRDPAHYGLSLILGGAESTPWEMAGMYASLARELTAGEGESREAGRGMVHAPVWHPGREPEPGGGEIPKRGAVYLMLEAMTEVVRPDEESRWHYFAASRKVAWKTGTSFGNRDAWAVGVTPECVVVVWVGNASGEGRPGLTGLGMAAPVLFDILRILPPGGWFQKPAEDLEVVTVCSRSGYRSGPACGVPDTLELPPRCATLSLCPWHRLLHLDRTGVFQVNASCYEPSLMEHRSWFILPPAMAWYYSRKNPRYQQPPPWMPGCDGGDGIPSMALIYPRDGSRLFLPVELDGTSGAIVCQAAHQDPEAVIYWHVDQTYAGMTSRLHQMELAPAKGWHRLTLVDDRGEQLTVAFEIQ